jgi:hypothetical protein
MKILFEERRCKYMYAFYTKKDRLAILISVLVLSVLGVFTIGYLFSLEHWQQAIITFVSLFIFQYVAIILPSIIHATFMSEDSVKKLRWIISEAQKELNDIEKPMDWRRHEEGK